MEHRWTIRRTTPAATRSARWPPGSAPRSAAARHDRRCRRRRPDADRRAADRSARPLSEAAVQGPEAGVARPREPHGPAARSRREELSRLRPARRSQGARDRRRQRDGPRRGDRFAREGADVAINYYPTEEPDAREVVALIRPRAATRWRCRATCATRPSASSSSPTRSRNSAASTSSSATPAASRRPTRSSTSRRRSSTRR